MREMQKAIILAALLLLPTTSFSQTGKVLDRLPFELIIDIFWQGKDIQIRRVLSCELRRRMHPGNITSVDPGLKLRDVWEQNVDRIYHVLPSGEVLIVVLPHQCNTFNKWLDPLPEGFLPITYWVDSAESPQLVEKITSSRYFTENPRRRFEMSRFRQIEAKHLADKIDDDQRLADLVDSRIGGYDALSIGFAAIAFPKSVWERYPALAAELNRYTKSGAVERDLVVRTALPLLGSCENAAQGIGPSERCLTNLIDTRPYVISAVLEGGVWRLSFDEPGVRRLFRYKETTGSSNQRCPPVFQECNVGRDTYRFEIDGTVYEFLMQNTGIFFDVNKQMLLRVGLIVDRGKLNRGARK